MSNNIDEKNNGNNIEAIDISGLLLDILGIIINLENLRLNEEQSKGIMHELSENQDKMLEKIIEQNIVIIQQNERLENLLKKLVK